MKRMGPDERRELRDAIAGGVAFGLLIVLMLGVAAMLGGAS